MASNVIGVGYEGLDIEGLLAKLRLRDVRTLVDVRLNAISRKRGLSKTALAARLESEGIAYRHLPALGNPRDNREAFARFDDAAGIDARARFTAILRGADAQVALESIRDLTSDGSVALLCFEQDEARCHRELILNALHPELVEA